MELFFKSLFVSLTFLLMLMMPQKVLTYTYFPVGKIAKKSSLKKSVFGNSALKIQCHVVKYTLLQTAFSAILPTEFYSLLRKWDRFSLFTLTRRL